MQAIKKRRGGVRESLGTVCFKEGPVRLPFKLLKTVLDAVVIAVT